MVSRLAARIPEAWLVTGSAALLMALTTGSRSAFGLFVSPLNSATGLGITTISFAAALSQLAWGAAQPAAGMLADRYGASRVVIAGGLLLALASALVPFVHSAASLIFALAFGAVAGAAAGGNSVLFGLVSRRVPADGRGLATGIVGAGGSAGQLMIAPATQAMIAGVGWMNAMFALAVLALAALPVALGLRHPIATSGAGCAAPAPKSEGGHRDGFSAGLRGALAQVAPALRSPRYWVVTTGFFVCGFHVSFLLAHMPGVIDQCGLSANVAGTWIGIVGLCNIAGSIGSGLLMQRVPMKHLLAALYAARALGVAVFLLLPKSAWTLYAFAVWMGVTYMATLPPTSGLIGKYFGVQRLSTLLGITMLVHQIGSFLGVWLGGVALEFTGGYDVLWAADIVLASIAALIHLPLPEVAESHAVTWKLDTGQDVTVRPVKAGDAGAIQAFVRRLSTQSRTRRFFSAIHELDQASLARLTAPDDGRDSVLLALAGDGSSDDIVAIGQYAGDPATRSCEIAFVVADQWQGQGLGARLMGALLEHAQKAGFERVEGAVLVDNRPMLTLARRSGFEVLPSDHEPSVRRIVRKIRRTLAAGSEALRPHGGGSGRPLSAAA